MLPLTMPAARSLPRSFRPLRVLNSYSAWRAVAARCMVSLPSPTFDRLRSTPSSAGSPLHTRPPSPHGTSFTALKL